MRSYVIPSADYTVEIHDENGALVWSFTSGHAAGGLASMDYLKDGTQQRIIDALLAALVEARGQLRRPALDISNVVADLRAATA